MCRENVLDGFQRSSDDMVEEHAAPPASSLLAEIAAVEAEVAAIASSQQVV